MTPWIVVARGHVFSGRDCVLATVVRTQGSTPREVGAQLVATTTASDGTIGGGRLEADVLEHARALLGQPLAATGRLVDYRLGPTLGQCCGGSVQVALQRFGSGDRVLLDELLACEAARTPYRWTAEFLPLRSQAVLAVRRTLLRKGVVVTGSPELVDAHPELLDPWGPGLSPEPRFLVTRPLGAPTLIFPPEQAGPGVFLFGAGHVGRALVEVLAPLHWALTWVDTRAEQMPQHVPHHVQGVVTDVPEMWAQRAPAGAIFLIMTQDHALDYRLCELVLKRGDFAYCGMIGSKTKREKFALRMGARGMSDEALSRLTCPVGLPGLGGKAPGEVAIAVAAQLLQLARESGGRRDADAVQASGLRSGPSYADDRARFIPEPADPLQGEP